MTRTADFTIQGFLYQFNKTLLEILTAESDTTITVEGIIEDIELHKNGEIQAIQCKYHESLENFTLSAIYKPLLQMMQHYVKNSHLNVNYNLYAHIPNIDEKTFKVVKSDLEEMLKSKNQKFTKYISDITNNIDLDLFLNKLKLKVGPSYDDICKEVISSFLTMGFSKEDVESLLYPNAINIIASFSIKHVESERKITKDSLLDMLRTIKKTAVNFWTLSLKTKHQILSARRKQLKNNLSKNSRLRYFVIDEKKTENFSSEIVLFIVDYLEKYHSKVSHNQTPLFCLYCTPEALKKIRVRLHQKNISSNNGYVEDYFDETYFFKEPILKITSGVIHREFSLRLLRGQDHFHLLNSLKPADIFIIGESPEITFNSIDVNIELLSSSSLTEINYILGITDAYE